MAKVAASSDDGGLVDYESLLTQSNVPKSNIIKGRNDDDDHVDDVDDFVDCELDDDPVMGTSCLGLVDTPFAATVTNIACLPLCLLGCLGCFVINERQHAAVLYFGKYVGSVQTPGIHFSPPLCRELRRMSTATRTMDMKNLKVVDSRGNPVIVSAVVTFEATSAKKARIDVENPWPNATWQPHVTTGTFLQLQAQAVLKQVTSQFPYEAPPGKPSLQTEGRSITRQLVETLQRRVLPTGARILSFDLVDLSYAPEIAQSMLLRQQATALVEARKLIVEAAVDMTSTAIQDLQTKAMTESSHIEPLRQEAIERISSNLLTVVCSNEAVTPMVSMNSENEIKEEHIEELTNSIKLLNIRLMQMQQSG